MHICRNLSEDNGIRKTKIRSKKKEKLIITAVEIMRFKRNRYD